MNEGLMKNGSFWMPSQASTFAPGIDVLYDFIFSLSIVLFVVLFVVTAYFIIKYRRKTDDQLAVAQIIDNDALELTWTLIPLGLVMLLFVWGFNSYLGMTVPPSDAMDIKVTSKKWNWQFDYPEKKITTFGDLTVPVDTPIRLVMSSQDVIHSFFVPNLRIKQDSMPNRYTTVWFQATKVGRFQIFCAEYCGDAHSDMLGNLIVLSKKDYEKWLDNGGPSTAGMSLTDLGQRVYQTQCSACHSIDNSPETGPTVKGLYGKLTQTSAGAVKADENYLRESIVDPMAKIVTGYPAGMITFAGILKDREIDGVIEYIKTLK